MPSVIERRVKLKEGEKKLIGGSDRLKPRSSGATDYVNNKGLYAALLEFGKEQRKAKREKREPPRFNDYIGKCILLICNKLSLNRNFIGYTFRDEMINDGIEKCTAALYNNFDPKKSNNPFGYLTQIAWNAFIARIQREKKQAYIKHKNFLNSYIMEGEVVQSGSVFADDLISKFEEGIAKNKAKAKAKKGVEKFMEED